MHYIFIAASFGELSRKFVMLVIHDIVDICSCDIELIFKLSTNKGKNVKCNSIIAI